MKDNGECVADCVLKDKICLDTIRCEDRELCCKNCAGRKHLDHDKDFVVDAALVKKLQQSVLNTPFFRLSTDLLEAHKKLDEIKKALPTCNHLPIVDFVLRPNKSILAQQSKNKQVLIQNRSGNGGNIVNNGTNNSSATMLFQIEKRKQKVKVFLDEPEIERSTAMFFQQWEEGIQELTQTLQVFKARVADVFQSIRQQSNLFPSNVIPQNEFPALANHHHNNNNKSTSSFVDQQVIERVNSENDKSNNNNNINQKSMDSKGNIKNEVKTEQKQKKKHKQNMTKMNETLKKEQESDYEEWREAQQQLEKDELRQKKCQHNLQRGQLPKMPPKNSIEGSWKNNDEDTNESKKLAEVSRMSSATSNESSRSIRAQESSNSMSRKRKLQQQQPLKSIQRSISDYFMNDQSKKKFLKQEEPNSFKDCPVGSNKNIKTEQSIESNQFAEQQQQQQVYNNTSQPKLGKSSGINPPSDRLQQVFEDFKCKSEETHNQNAFSERKCEPASLMQVNELLEADGPILEALLKTQTSVGKKPIGVEEMMTAMMISSQAGFSAELPQISTQEATDRLATYHFQDEHYHINFPEGDQKEDLEKDIARRRVQKYEEINLIKHSQASNASFDLCTNGMICSEELTPSQTSS